MKSGVHMMIKNRNQLARILRENDLADKVIIHHYNEVEIYLQDEEGYTDYGATDDTFNEVTKLLGWGGFSTGYGGWILKQNFQDLGDWNDKSSRWHY